MLISVENHVNFNDKIDVKARYVYVAVQVEDHVTFDVEIYAKTHCVLLLEFVLKSTLNFC